jgi:uncharacterized protein YfdQ (DUF2303 family)
MADTNPAVSTGSGFVEQLAAEMQRPQIIQTATPATGMTSRVAVPKGWTIVDKDEARILPQPARKVATITANDADSFISYMKRHGSIAGNSTIWCSADYTKRTVAFIGIVNDHGEAEGASAWRDHLAHFRPQFSEEWARWTGKDGQVFSQVDFAKFIEDNVRDFATVEGMPTGAQMLEMALAFEANQDLRFKSQVRLQNGGVQLAFAADDDVQTLQKMAMFERFSIGLPVFWGGEAYRLDARLRYRVRDGKVSFWFDLIRPDRVLEDATKILIDKIQGSTGLPFFFGVPGV